MILGKGRRKKEKRRKKKREERADRNKSPSWTPQKDRETVLMMHETAVGCINAAKPVRFGLPKFDHKKNQGSWFRKSDQFLLEDLHHRIVGSRKGGTCTSLVGSS